MSLSPETEKKKSNEPYYDLFEDWDLIVSSFLSQYGIRLSTKEFKTVDWAEFSALLSGLSADTALGKVVAIRSETDQETIKRFSSYQKKIYDDWRTKQSERMTEEEYAAEMKKLEASLFSLLS
nr:MAG TPA: hypothetical protein [Caudoviricetes sp.]